MMMKNEMKAMTIGTLFDNAFRMSFGKFKDVLIVTMLFFVFIILIAGISAAIFFGLYGWENMIKANITSMDYWLNFWPEFIAKIGPVSLISISFVLIVIFLIADIIYNGVLNHLFLKTFMGEDWKIRQSIGAVWKKTPSLLFSVLPMTGITIAFFIGAFILMGILAALTFGIGGFAIQTGAVGIFALIMFASGIGIFIFMIYGAVVFQMVAPVILGEDRTGGKAVIRAFTLANYNIMGISGAYLLLLIMGMVIGGIIGLLFGVLSMFLSDLGVFSSAAVIIYFVFYILCTLFIGAIGKALIITIFYNLKIKNEGFGVESMVADYIESGDKKDIDEK